MPGQGRRLEIRWTETADALAARLAAERSPRRRERLQLLLLLREGMRLVDACAQLELEYRSAQRWIEWYRTDGLEGMLARTPGHRAPGRPPLLTPTQVAALVVAYEAGQFVTTRDAIAWVETQFGVTYSVTGLHALLRRVQERRGDT